MKKTIGYMCKLAWRHELTEAPGGQMIYSTLKSLKENHPCWERCGIVEIDMTLSKEVQPETMAVQSEE